MWLRRIDSARHLIRLSSLEPTKVNGHHHKKCLQRDCCSHSAGEANRPHIQLHWYQPITIPTLPAIGKRSNRLFGFVFKPFAQQVCSGLRIQQHCFSTTAFVIHTSSVENEVKPVPVKRSNKKMVIVIVNITLIMDISIFLLHIRRSY